MKVSLGSWPFSFGPYAPHPIPLEKIARRAADAGYDGLELSGYPPQVTPENYRTKDAVDQLLALLMDHGLSISGYNADFGSVNPATPRNEQRYLELFRRQVDLCNHLGSPAIRVDTVAAPGSLPDEQYQAAFGRIAQTWSKCAEIALRAHVKMVWEFEPGFVYNKPSEIVALHEAVGHPGFQVLFDTGHAYMCSVIGARQEGEPETLGGGVIELIGLLEGRIGAVHVIDSDGTLYEGETTTHTPFGEGLIDWGEVAPKLLAVPGIDWWCVDLCFCDRAWDLVEDSLAAVRRLLPS